MGRNQNSIFVSENGETKKSGNGVCVIVLLLRLYSLFCVIFSVKREREEKIEYKS